MRDYELTLILAPTLGEKELEKEVKKLQDQISKLGAKLKQGKDPVKRHLAYPINKVGEGFEVFFDLNAESAMIKPIEEGLRLDDFVIRYLMIKKD